MIYLDSWVWISFFSDEMTAGKVEGLLARVEAGEKAVMSVIGLMEIRYIISRRFGNEYSERIFTAITSFRNLLILPVNEECAVLGADLRRKYYDRIKNTMSYADAVHLATAILSGCREFYSGDPDFAAVDGIEVRLINRLPSKQA